MRVCGHSMCVYWFVLLLYYDYVGHSPAVEEYLLHDSSSMGYIMMVINVVFVLNTQKIIIYNHYCMQGSYIV